MAAQPRLQRVLRAGILLPLYHSEQLLRPARGHEVGVLVVEFGDRRESFLSYQKCNIPRRKLHSRHPRGCAKVLPQYGPAP